MIDRCQMTVKDVHGCWVDYAKAFGRVMTSMMDLMKVHLLMVTFL